MYTKQNFDFLPKTKLSSLGGEGGGVMIKGKLSLTDFAVFPTLLKCKVGCHTDEDCAYGLRCRTDASQRVCLHKYLSKKSNAPPTMIMMISIAQQTQICNCNYYFGFIPNKLVQLCREQSLPVGVNLLGKFKLVSAGAASSLKKFATLGRGLALRMTTVVRMICLW